MQRKFRLFKPSRSNPPLGKKGANAAAQGSSSTGIPVMVWIRGINGKLWEWFRFKRLRVLSLIIRRGRAEAATPASESEVVQTYNQKSINKKYAFKSISSVSFSFRNVPIIFCQSTPRAALAGHRFRARQTHCESHCMTHVLTSIFFVRRSCNVLLVHGSAMAMAPETGQWNLRLPITNPVY